MSSTSEDEGAQLAPFVEFPIPADALRERTVHWRDAAMAGPLTAGLSGWRSRGEYATGRCQPRRWLVAEPSEIAMMLDYEASLENTLRMLHGGVAATMPDTAMGPQRTPCCRSEAR
ncbi:hypothetical protein [Sphingomonas sp. SAFR-052]|uniref:hypothetical protein n=1 Tax=Sphingomonas sp. SAFR-052 TaxID=3436867 RepID=UPI003F7E7C46